MGTLVELLLSLILAMTGISRTTDAGLTAVAEARVVEIQAPDGFDHDLMRPGTAEVLLWNRGYPDGTTATRAAAQGWRDSPSHWSILTSGSLTRIGCAVTLADETWWFACVLAPGTTPSTRPTPSPESPSTSPGGPTPVSPTTDTPMLPDTSVAGVWTTPSPEPGGVID